MKKIKTLLTTVSFMLLFYLFYMVYYTPNKNDTIYIMFNHSCNTWIYRWLRLYL